MDFVNSLVTAVGWVVIGLCTIQAIAIAIILWKWDK